MGFARAGDWTWTVWRGTQASSRLDRECVVPISTAGDEDRMLKLMGLPPERLLEIIGEDLMLGADQARIVERDCQFTAYRSHPTS
jgi:hypothetical protein